MNNNITIVISCAGMGKRLGLGTTKALCEVAGKPLLIRQLELLTNYNDVKVVVGYKSEEVVNTVKKYGFEVDYLYNYEFETTGTAASFSKALPVGKEYVVALDGDLLVHPDDLIEFLEYDGELVGGCVPTTDNPVLMTVQDDMVIEFSRERGDLEWTGLAKLKKERLTAGSGHVYQMIEPLMPIKVKQIRTKEIDTPNDYQNAVKWIENNYQD